MNAAVVVVSLLVGIFLLILLSTYNGLIHLRQEIRLAWAKMDDQLKLRYGLVTSLSQLVQTSGGVTAVKLPPVTSAKNSAAVAFDPAQLAKAEAALTAGLRELIAAGEIDPNLKSNPAFVDICDKLAANEKAISQTCHRYNDRVDALNASMSGFPHVITAKAIGFHVQPMFDLRG